MNKVTRRSFLGAVSSFAMALSGSRQAEAQSTRGLIVQAATSAPGIGSTDFYVAEKVGFFKEEGLAPEIRYSTGASQAAQIVASRGADIGRFAFDPVLAGYDKGLHLRSFYQFYQTLIYYLAVPDDSAIKKIEDVKGKTIAVVNMGSAAVGVFRSMLRQAHMPLDSATLIPVGKADAGLAALRAGRVDGFMFWNEVYSSMLTSGAKLRFIKHPTMGEIGQNGYFATDALLKEREADLAGFSRAIAKSCVFIQANMAAAAKIYVGATREENDPAHLAKVTDQMKFWSESWVIGDDRQYGLNNGPNLERYADVMREEGVLTRVPPIEQLFTNALVSKANDFDKEKVRSMARSWT